MKYNTDNAEFATKVASFWASTIEKFCKYFHAEPDVYTEKLHDENGGTWVETTTWSAIVSPKKEWLFGMLNRLKGNVNNIDGCTDSFYHTGGFAKCQKRRLEFNGEVLVDENGWSIYKVLTKPYLNNNTLVIIKHVRFIYKQNQ